jgi:hypothetical protein
MKNAIDLIARQAYRHQKLDKAEFGCLMFYLNNADIVQNFI